ncbi:MAG: hypothetical protein HZA90_04260 [Verrucomicrobia bacterium]|nr:hypothetical protein [Verrucomicrobiota bacterium]
MNKAVFIIATWLAATGWSPAQVAVELLLEQEQYLRNESLPLRVRISNSSGQTLRFGAEADWLAFEIQDTEGHAVRRLGKVPLADPFNLGSARVATLKTDLMPYFDLSSIGHFSVSATLKVGQLNASFSSRAESFNIISGSKIWEREFGVPRTSPPDVRKYALVQATFLKQLRLYARITDPHDQKVFRVQALGPLVSFSKPTAQLDKSCNLHALFQTGARSFLYEIVTPDGELIIRQTHEHTETRPTLQTADDGTLFVAGGRRLVLLNDLPPPALSPSPTDLSTNHEAARPPQKKAL